MGWSRAAARARGLDVLVVEKADVLGGTSAWSGGVLWTPDNPPVMREAGARDSFSDVLIYALRFSQTGGSNSAGVTVPPRRIPPG